MPFLFVMRRGRDFSHPSLSFILRNPGFLAFVPHTAGLFAFARSDTLQIPQPNGYFFKYQKRHLKKYMRRGRDLNPRGVFTPARFRVVCLRPLSHPSKKHYSTPERNRTLIFPLGRDCSHPLSYGGNTTSL